MVVFIGGGLRLEFVTSVVSELATIDVPSTVIAGDLLVMADKAARNFFGVADVIPSGFSPIISTQGTFGDIRVRVSLSYKIATSGDISATLTGLGAADPNEAGERKILMVFRGSKSLTSVTVQDTNGEATGGTPATQVKNASAGVAPIIVLGQYATGAVVTIDPRGFNIDGVDAKDAEIVTTPSASPMWAAYKIMNTPGQRDDVSVFMEDEGTSNLLQSAFLECSAA